MSEELNRQVQDLITTLAKVFVGIFSSWMVGVMFVAIFDYHSWIFLITSMFFFGITSALLMNGDSDG